MGYFLDDFKKMKPPTFAGELKNLEDAQAWFLGMKKLFELHDYIKNMKAWITIFNLKGKEYILWEDVKCYRNIRTNDFSWHDFKRLFDRKYLQIGTMTEIPRSSTS